MCKSECIKVEGKKKININSPRAKKKFRESDGITARYGTFSCIFKNDIFVFVIHVNVRINCTMLSFSSRKKNHKCVKF